MFKPETSEGSDSEPSESEDGSGMAPKLPAQPTLPATHCLTVNVKVAQTFVGEAPGGFRVDFYYSGEPPIVAAPGAPFTDSLKELLDVSYVKSGSDWVTIGTQGVIDFDSRVTLALGGEELLVTGKLRGRANLRDVMSKYHKLVSDPSDSHDTILARWRSGFADDSYLPVVLAASFDVPLKGYDAKQTSIYKQVRALADSLFIGAGKAFFKKAPYGEVQRLQLNLYVIEPGAIAQLGKKGTTNGAGEEETG